MSEVIRIGKESFSASIEHISFVLRDIESMDDLKNLRLFSELKSADFGDSILDDVGLEHLSHVTTLENLNLQGTRISDGGLACLQRLPRLQYLRLKDNRQLTNACAPHLLGLSALVELQIHETSIDQHGLGRLEGMKNLRHIVLDVRDGNYSFDGLLALSKRMPCTILAKGHGEFFQGRFDGVWNADET